MVQVSYNRLWKKLVDMKMSQSDLRKTTGLSSGTMTKLRRDEDVSMDALKKICDVCKCNIGEVVDFYPDNKIQ